MSYFRRHLCLEPTIYKYSLWRFTSAINIRLWWMKPGVSYDQAIIFVTNWKPWFKNKGVALWPCFMVRAIHVQWYSYRSSYKRWPHTISTRLGSTIRRTIINYKKVCLVLWDHGLNVVLVWGLREDSGVTNVIDIRQTADVRCNVRKSTNKITDPHPNEVVFRVSDPDPIIY